MACDDVLSLQDLQIAKKHDIFHAEVITGKSGGLATGADIDTATNAATGQVQTTLPKTLRDVGFKLGSGDFTTGFTVLPSQRDTAWFNPVDKNWYAYLGAIPSSGHLVVAGTDPTVGGEWKPVTENILQPTVIESARRGCAEAGYNLVVGSFQEGFTLVNSNDAALDWVTGKVFSGAPGSYTGGTSIVGFTDRSGALLRKQSHYSVAEMVANQNLNIGDNVSWSGYYEPLDLGGNTGVVVAGGTGTDDGGSFFDLANGLQVKADTRQINFYHFGGRPGLGVTTNSVLLLAYKSFVDAVPGRGYRFDFNNGEVYRLTTSHDFAGKPVSGRGFSGGCSSYTFLDTALKSCIYLDGMVVEAQNVVKATDVGFVSNRAIQTGSTVYHTKRQAVYFDNVELWHGAYNLRCPYGAIPLKVFGGVIDRASIDNIYVQDLEDAGSGNPDRDTNIVLLDSARIGYAARHNVNLNCRGGIFKITNGTDITKAGEPAGLPGNNSINMNAFGVRIANPSTGVVQCIEIDNCWMEKNANMLQFVGIIRNIDVNNIRTSAFDNTNRGKLIELNGFIYDADFRNINGSGPKYVVGVDVENFNADSGTGVSNINNINIDKTVRWADAIVNIATAKGVKFAREVGGFTLQSYPAGSCTGVSASGAGGLYTLSGINGLTPITLQPTWFFNAGQAVDVSLYVGGQYAGEITTSNATTFTSTKLLASVGDGSVELYVKKKHYDENIKPSSFYQGVGFR